jgi:hypothetical protein
LNLAASGLHGWVYYTSENNWPITAGISLMLAGIVAAVQIALSERIISFVFSCALVTLFVTLQAPILLVACAGFGACI